MTRAEQDRASIVAGAVVIGALIFAGWTVFLS
jgi:hypothetical protein